MPGLTMETARQLLATTTTEDHLFEHAIGVSAAMGAMARHFGADEEYWKAVGYLHDYDYEQFPEEHLHHTAEPLREAGVDEESIRAILSHGWEFCTDVKPETDMEKSLFTVDELTGLVGATARMRPGGLSDLEVSSVKKKFKDKRFAAKLRRQDRPGGHPAGLRHAGHGPGRCDRPVHRGHAHRDGRPGPWAEGINRNSKGSRRQKPAGPFYFGFLSCIL